MNERPRPSWAERGLLVVTALLAAVGLLVQLWVLLAADDASRPRWQTWIAYFSYFTIQSNIGVALACAFGAMPNSSGLSAFFVRPRVRGSIALYILVTALIYRTVLQQLWDPQGAQKLADVLLHQAAPGLYLFAWIFFGERLVLGIADAFRWLLYPLGYFVWVLVRGAWLGEYPYPFLDVKALGLKAVLLNGLGMTGVFLGLGFVLLLIDKWMGRKLASARRLDASS